MPRAPRRPWLATAPATPVGARPAADQLEKDKTSSKELADEFNTWMDDLLGQDFFGTEGQCDPRGDHRD